MPNSSACDLQASAVSIIEVACFTVQPWPRTRHQSKSGYMHGTGHAGGDSTKEAVDFETGERSHPHLR